MLALRTGPVIYSALFLLFTAYERVVSTTRLLEGLRSNIFAVLQRSGPTDPRG